MAATDGPDGSVFDALFVAIAEREGVEFEAVRETLLHRQFPGDHFWFAWDQALVEGVDLFQQVKREEASVG